jgi:hypothetical protein
VEGYRALPEYARRLDGLEGNKRQGSPRSVRDVTGQLLLGHEARRSRPALDPFQGEYPYSYHSIGPIYMDVGDSEDDDRYFISA